MTYGRIPWMEPKPAVTLRPQKQRRSRAVRMRPAWLGARRTSVSVEDEFWRGLKQIAREEKMTLAALLRWINVDRATYNFSSAIRLFVFSYFKARADASTMSASKPANKTDVARSPAHDRKADTSLPEGPP